MVDDHVHCYKNNNNNYKIQIENLLKDIMIIKQITMVMDYNNDLVFIKKKDLYYKKIQMELIIIIILIKLMHGIEKTQWWFQKLMVKL